MVKTFKYKGRTVVINYKDFEKEIDIDRLLQIDYQRLPAEMITFPVILNKLGFLLADASNKVKECELDLEIFLAKKNEEVRLGLIGEKKTKRWTDNDVNQFQKAEVKGSGAYRVKQKILIKAQKEYDMINSLYWAAKDKSDKLNKLSEKLHGDEIEYDLNEVKGTINGVKVRINKPVI
jgi:hypothetical protein